MLNISSHANHRHEDYFFERTQSRAFQDLRWRKTTPPLQSWSGYLYPALAGAGALVALIEIIH